MSKLFITGHSNDMLVKHEELEDRPVEVAEYKANALIGSWVPMPGQPGIVAKVDTVYVSDENVDYVTCTTTPEQPRLKVR
jgi:hypothetical protein